MSTALAKTEELESASKDKMQQLNSSLSDHNQTILELQERLVHLQKALTNSENDRRLLQVGLYYEYNCCKLTIFLHILS
ncbi:unnamed protein product [Trichobilharzia regenti]|nr:unnamed protein product [Trichobilharzia regenti]